MNVGSMRHRVSILQKVEREVSDSFTSNTIYNTLGTVWAKIESVQGLVRFDTKQVGEEITHKITVRNYPYISSENWLKFQNRKFNIRFVRDFDERAQYLELLCQEVFTDEEEFTAGDNVAGDPLSEISE